MKKLGILLIAIFSITLLSACNSTDNTDNAENTTTEKVVDTKICKEAIQSYLDETNSEGSQTGPQAKAGDQVIAMYVGRFNDEEVFDTNVKSVAEACGLPYYPSLAEWLPFTIDKPGIIQGFSKGAKWLRVWETKTVSVLPEEGYGPSDPTKIFTRPISEIEEPNRIVEGMQIQLGNISAIVTKKTATEITIDANHPMAGKTLIFDITLKEIFPQE